MRGFLAFQLELWIFESPGGLHFPTFGSVGFTLTLSPKVGLRQFGFDLDLGQVVLTCFAIPLVVVAVAVLFIWLSLKQDDGTMSMIK
jgi:hypothetical protein